MCKILAIGSSSVNIFKALESKDFTIFKFKGISMKSIINETKHYHLLLKFLNNKTFDYCIHVFGEVDLNFYYYYKKFIMNEEPNIFKIPQLYCNLIKTLPNIKKHIVINVPYSPTSTDFFILQLKTYLFDYADQINNQLIPKEECSIKFRQTMIDKFNILLEKNCIINNYKFINFNKYIINKNYTVNKLFIITYSPVNIHLFFEHVLLVILYKTDLHFLNNENLEYKMNKDFDEWKIYKKKKALLKKRLNSLLSSEDYEKYRININKFHLQIGAVMKYLKNK